ncbi:MAG TPA: hypothetical protein P5181_02555 [Dermatophilaceae bacterium]|nr:hypothetical protein [Dermatophilaceae bacterium]
MPWRRAESSYDHLNVGHVLRTIERLQARIAETFPRRHLADVAGTVHSVISRMVTDAERQRPVRLALRIVSRVVIVVLVALSILTIVLAIRDAAGNASSRPAFEWLPILESGINDVVFAGIAIWFLISLEGRWHRHRLLATLHRLRSLAHVVDMHQMSKDATQLLPPADGPEHHYPVLTAAEFGRYLDFCSELLSLIGKGAALCAESSTDAVVLDTVSEIETLTTGISRKVWQKITLLQRYAATVASDLLVASDPSAGSAGSASSPGLVRSAGSASPSVGTASEQLLD